MISKLSKYRVVCSAIVTNHQGKLLLLKRAQPIRWEVPAGHVDWTETLVEGLFREVYEETGLTDIELRSVLRVGEIHSLENDTAKIPRLVIAYWLVLNSDEQVSLSEEHTDYLWIEPVEAINKVSLRGIQDEIKEYLKRSV